MSVLRDDEERKVVNFNLAHEKKNGMLSMSPASKEKNLSP